MKDLLGQEIKEGDIVAHGQRSGNSGSIQVKLVTELRQRDHYGDKIDEVKVIGYSQPTHKYNKDTGKWEETEAYYKMNDRGGWTTPDVLIVINDQVPAELKDFLTQY